MIVIKKDNTQGMYEYHFAASKKAVPGLVQEMSNGKGIESTVANCEYFEFNTRENRTGVIGPFKPLSDLVIISCGLAPTAADDEEENGEE